MTSGDVLICLGLVIPLFGAVASYAVGRMPDVRDTLTLVIGILLCIVTITLFLRVGGGDAPRFLLFGPAPGFEIAFRLEPLGALFGMMASVEWAISSLFAIGYLRSRGALCQTRFCMLTAVSIFAVMGIAMAANLLTIFIFCELLTISTCLLVIQSRDISAQRAGRRYLYTLVGAAAFLFLPGVIAVASLAGSTRFVPGGILEGRVDNSTGGIMLILLVLGPVKTGLMPLFGRGPRITASYAPVSAFLMILMAAQAAIFIVLKVAAYTFGADLVTRLPVSGGLLWLAAGSAVVASLVALTKDDLKIRVAWATLSQLSCVISAAFLPMGAGIVAGGLHLAVQSLALITLAMSVGAMDVAAGVSRISQAEAIRGRVPAVLICFLLGALSITGLPPLPGMWSRLLLIDAAFRTHEWWTGVAFLLASFFSLFCLAPVGLRALFSPAVHAGPVSHKPPVEVAGTMTAALIVAASGSLFLFILADYLAGYLGLMNGDAP